MVKNLLAMQKTQVQSLGIPWRRAWRPTPVFLRILENFMDRGAWNSPWGCKRVREDLATEQQQQ